MSNPMIYHSETKIEPVGMDPDYKELIKEVLAQNQKVLEMNERLLYTLTNPHFILRTEGTDGTK